MQDLQVKKTCKICRKKLNLGKIYCSFKCYWRNSPKFKTSCRQCSKKFWTYPSFIKAGEGFLCSNKCKYEWRSKNYKGEKTRKHSKLANIARAKLNHEINVGRVKRLPCKVCLEKKSHGHHEDYSKPLKVIWLCHKHHQLLHTGKLTI